MAVGAVIAAMIKWSGGWSLVSLYTEYLSQDRSDKKLSYVDFTDRGARAMLSGYYAGRVGDNVYIWTYSGLRRFTHKSGTSVYYLMSTCGIVKEMAEKGKIEGGVKISPWMTYKLDEWQAGVKRGDYVWVVRVGEGAESKIIDKIWASDNPHYPYRGVTLSECQKR